jgi:hypothetical protein
MLQTSKLQILLGGVRASAASCSLALASLLGQQPKNRDSIDELRVFQGCVSLVPARNQLYTCGIRDDLMRDRIDLQAVFRHTLDADITHSGSVCDFAHLFIYSGPGARGGETLLAH